jgi:hypothetical protein
MGERLALLPALDVLEMEMEGWIVLVFRTHPPSELVDHFLPDMYTESNLTENCFSVRSQRFSLLLQTFHPSRNCR